MFYHFLFERLVPEENSVVFTVILESSIMMPSFPQSPAPFFTGVLQGSPQASSAAGTCQSDTVTVAWQHSVCSPFSHVRLSFFYCGLLIIYPLRIVRNLEVSSVLFCCWAETSHCQDNELWGELISGDLRD